MSKTGIVYLCDINMKPEKISWAEFLDSVDMENDIRFTKVNLLTNPEKAKDIPVPRGWSQEDFDKMLSAGIIPVNKRKVE